MTLVVATYPVLPVLPVYITNVSVPQQVTTTIIYVLPVSINSSPFSTLNPVCIIQILMITVIIAKFVVTFYEAIGFIILPKMYIA